jgi:hypothetical protein
MESNSGPKMYKFPSIDSSRFILPHIFSRIDPITEHRFITVSKKVLVLEFIETVKLHGWNAFFYCFETKGLKHIESQKPSSLQNSKPVSSGKKSAAEQKIDAFVNLVVTEGRLEQGLQGL